MKHLLVSLITLAAVSTEADAQSFVDTFENGANVGGWAYFTGSSTALRRPNAE